MTRLTGFFSATETPGTWSPVTWVIMLFEITVIFICLALGGMLKGATGAGAPLLAVPALAAIFDVSFAIAIMLVPNMLTNAWQIWRYRESRPESGFLALFVVGGVAGVAAGTWLLTSLSSDALLVTLAVIVLAYIGLRLVKPHVSLSRPVSRLLALPAGIGGGILQGSTGIAAPISLTFLNAVRLPRPTFIFTVSLHFCLFTIVQLPALSLAGIMTPERLFLSALAVIPVTLAMPLGGRLARHLPDWAFDRLILAFLGVVAIKLLFDALI